MHARTHRCASAADTPDDRGPPDVLADREYIALLYTHTHTHVFTHTHTHARRLTRAYQIADREWCWQSAAGATLSEARTEPARVCVLCI